MNTVELLEEEIKILRQDRKKLLQLMATLTGKIEVALSEMWTGFDAEDWESDEARDEYDRAQDHKD